MKVVKPKKPTKGADGTTDDVEQDIYDKQIERMVVQLEKIDAASVAVFAVVEGNCSNGVKGQLRTKDQYMDNKMKGNIS